MRRNKRSTFSASEEIPLVDAVAESHQLVVVEGEAAARPRNGLIFHALAGIVLGLFDQILSGSREEDPPSALTCPRKRRHSIRLSRRKKGVCLRKGGSV